VADCLPVVVVEFDADMTGDAFRWIGALVDPPMAELTTMAFSKASRVMMSLGLMSLWTRSTIRLPVS
jgi:hypothetical protein